MMWFVGEGREVDVDTHKENFSILLVQFAVGVLDTSFTKHVYIYVVQGNLGYMFLVY